MTVTITGTLKDVSGQPDNAIPLEVASVIRFADDGSVITEKPVVVRSVAGRVRFELEPGFAEVRYGRKVWRVNAPDTDSTLKELIEAAVAYPPDASQDMLDAAVGTYVEANRAQFRTRAVPIVSGPNAGKYQWLDEDDTPTGAPVPLTDIVPESIAQAAAQAAAEVVAPGVVDADIAGRVAAVEDVGAGLARFKLGGVFSGPSFPLPGGAWSSLVGTPDLERPIPGALRLYVDPVNGNDSYNGFTWYRAFKTIQAACNA
ncbi:hypothetical protein, partial [Mycobacterium sp. PSTR-4-N]|uniref:hypothetical protein n=1 Tax=Mycobacterium sp. PSTR-4-N TaxID=2917745 RepID=UPI001F155C21